MMFSYTLCVLLAPAAAHAAAFPWALPEATKIAPTPDNWSPAPTAAPQLRFPGSELFRRQTAQGGNTCGFVSGSSRRCRAPASPPPSILTITRTPLHMFRLKLRLRNKHPPRRPRLLRPRLPLLLHHSHNMHRIHRSLNPLHRRNMLQGPLRPALFPIRLAKLLQMDR
jgi:hypothetical protein